MAPAPARWTVAAQLAVGAVLDWCPEPTVVCDGAELHSRLRVALQRGAGAVLAGPAGTGGARVVVMLALVGEGINGPPAAVSALLDQAAPYWSEFGSALS